MARKRPGPKGLLPNPRPAEQWGTIDGHEVFLGTIDEVDDLELGYTADHLRAYFRKRREQLTLRPGEQLARACIRISRLAEEALSATAVWWSGYERQEIVDLQTKRLSPPFGRGGTRRHVGPTPPAKAEHGCLWLDTGAIPAIKEYDRASKSWKIWMKIDDSIAADPVGAGKFLADMLRPAGWYLKSSWPVLKTAALRGPIVRMLAGQMGRAGRSGRPAYLAYATLGALLDITPEKVADFLGNSRRKRRTPRGIHR